MTEPKERQMLKQSYYAMPDRTWVDEYNKTNNKMAPVAEWWWAVQGVRKHHGLPPVMDAQSAAAMIPHMGEVSEYFAWIVNQY